MTAERITEEGFRKIQEANWSRIGLGCLIEVDPRQVTGFRYALALEKKGDEVLIVLPLSRENILDRVFDGIVPYKVAVKKTNIMNVYQT